MAHDKEIIDNIKKINAFDSTYDPLVLEIDADEREKISKSIQEMDNKKEIESNINLQEDEKKEIVPKKEKKISFFKRVINFIKNLFSEISGDNSGLPSKELKRIKLILNEFEIPIIDLRNKKIKNTFAQYIKNLYEELNKIFLLFEEVYCENIDINITEPIFFIRYISNIISDELKGKLKIFTNEYLSSLIDNEKNPLVVLKTELQAFENAVSINERSNLTRFIEPFERLLSLYSYDFKQFFETFGLRFKIDGEESNKFESFNNIDGEYVVEELKKLNSFLRIINFSKLSEDVSEIFEITLESLQTPSETDLEENPDDINQDDDINNLDKNDDVEELNLKNKTTTGNKYDEINISVLTVNETIKKINTINEKNILDCVIELIKKDKEYKGKMAKFNIFIIDKYLNVLKEKVIANYNRLEVIKREEKIETSVCKYFKVKKMKELSSINNYNDEMNKNFEKRNIDKFAGVKKATLMKNFIEKFYSQGIENALKMLLVEGDFIDKSGQQEFSDAFYKIEQRQLDLVDFEKLVSDQGDEMTKIRNFLYSAMHDKNVKAVAKRKIHEVDERCDLIVKDFVIQLNTVYHYLDKCIRDSKSSRATFIYNMKTINGTNNRIFMNNIYKSYEIIKGFLDLTKNFIVIHNKV